MKKFLALAFLVFVFSLPFLFASGTAFADAEEYQVVARECYLYKSPSFEKEEVLTDEEGSPVVLKYRDKVSLAEGGQESEKFVYVNFQDYTGYVFKYYISSNINDQILYPAYNAKVVADKTEVFDLSGDSANFFIKSGTELYLLEGYKKVESKTAVAFKLEDGTLYYGYIATKDLEPYGVNGWVITGIVVAVSCITIILLLVFMKKKKVKKEI